MTILDMLDQLENEIVELRTRNRALQSILSEKQRGKRSPAPAQKTKRTKSVRKAAPTKKVANAASESDATNKPCLNGTAETEKPSIGKRQALGRSIVQLRRAGQPPADQQ